MKILKRLKQIIILVSIFSLGGVGITYAASTNQIQNFFLGNAPLASNNLNQVLALLVGPKGPPGPAGVAGRDGLIGLNGTNGLDGAPGKAGVPGIGAQTVALAVGDTNCPSGGVKIVDGSGNATYACNGKNGFNGANGANGTNGTNGTGGNNSGNGTLGFGQVNIGTCDSAVSVNLSNKYYRDPSNGHTFFIMDSITISDIDNACIDTVTVKSVKVYVPIRATGSLYGPTSPGLYANNDVIVCTNPITTNIVNMNSTFVCKNGSTNVLLNQISSQDIDPSLGFEISG